MVQPAAAPGAFTEVVIDYAWWATEVDKYTPEQELLCAEYLAAIVAPKGVLRPMLDPDFEHVDGALEFADGRFLVRHISTIVGREPFVDKFRPLVNANTEPAGGVYGTWISARDYNRVIAPQVPGSEARRDQLIGALAAKFEYRLRPDGSMFLPPPLHEMLAEGEEPFAPHYPVGTADHPSRFDRVNVNVTQALYLGPNGIIRREGFVTDDPTNRAVPFALDHQLTVLRGGGTPISRMPEDIATLIHYAPAASL